MENGNGTVEKLIDLRKIAAIVKKNWLVLSRDKIRFAPLFVFPFIMVILFGFTAGTLPKHIPAALVDYDNTQLSQEVQAQLYSNELISIQHQVGSQDEGKKLIDEGKIQVLIVIPAGFEDDINSGRTAHLNVVFDESNPSVAQITKASIQIFVQSLSQQLTAQRLSLVSQNAQQANQYLAQAKGALAAPLTQSSDPTLAAMNAYFKQGFYTGSKTSAGLSKSVQEMKNAMGYLIDQNAIASDAGKGTGDATAALLLLSVGDNQQSELQQIAIYEGLQGSNARMLSSFQAAYGECKALNAGANADLGAAKVSYNLIGAASGKIQEAQAAAQSAANTPLTLNEMMPYGNGLRGLDYLLPNILALIAFQGAVMGLGRAIAGERKDGSLTRVFLTPTSNVTIIIGTLLFYVLQETVRTMLIVLAAIVLFGLIVKGSLLSILGIVTIYALGATGVGMVISVITRSQEQYMAVSMLFTLPMMFLAGVFTPIETMPAALQGVAKVLPITYAADALRGVMIKGFTLGQVLPDLAFLAGFGIVTITLSLLLFRRELI